MSATSPSKSFISTTSSSAAASSSGASNIKYAASALQQFVDRFRKQNGLGSTSPPTSSDQTNDDNAAHRHYDAKTFSYESAVKNLRDWPQQLDNTIAGLATRFEHYPSDSKEVLGFSELSRQARRSVEVDVQRLISRWIREFIDKHKAIDPEETFKEFVSVLECCSPETLGHSSSQLLDASVQWLLPRAMRKCRKFRQALGKARSVQREMLQYISCLTDNGSALRRSADDSGRILAQCRVALSDFHSHSSQMIKELTDRVSSMSAAAAGGGGGGGGSGHDNDNNYNDDSLHILDRLSLTLSKYVAGMRDNLAASSTVAAAVSTTPAMPASVRSLLSQFSSLSPAGKQQQSREEEEALLLNLCGGSSDSDDVVVEIKATDSDKRQETLDRQFFSRSLLNSTVIKSVDTSLNDATVGGGYSHHHQQHEQQQQAATTMTSPGLVSSPNHAARVSSQQTAIESLQQQLADAQCLIHDSERSNSDREAVIDRLQANLSTMSGVLERVAAERLVGGAHGDGAAAGASALHSHHQNQVHHFHNNLEPFGGTTRKSEFLHEVDMLRSQVAVQQERASHLQSVVEEKALHEQSLKREVETLQASESVLKSELQYQQAAIRASNDDLVATQTALFETREMLAKCEKSRKEFSDAYHRLARVAAADRRFATSLATQTQQMSHQLENSVLLTQVEEMLQLQS